MAYKDILVHLDGSARGEVRLDIAIELAKRHQSHLTGLYPFEVPSPSLYMGDVSMFDLGVTDEIMTRARRQATAIAGAIEGRFRDKLAKSGVAGDWRLVEAPPADSVVHRARYADLVIAGQTRPDLPKPFGVAQVPVAAILHSGRPVLVIPYAGEVKSVGERVLIAWKEGREAARAVEDAMPFLAAARSVVALAIDPAPRPGGSEQPAAELARHLARHGIAVTVRHTVAVKVPEGDILLNEASDTGADLVVAGGYGHSRASEFVLGGVTRTLLAEMTVPVLFSH
jgi:nucleotide-binding universal stress UspA family protein